MIEVDDISKSFGSTRALAGISFNIDKGEVVGMLGPNGAGKSTTMRIIAGYLSPDSGRVTVAGEQVGVETVSAQRKIGYLPENNPLYRDMLVKDLFDFSADVRRIKKSQRREAYGFVVEACGIADVFYRPIKELSKGYRQRVGIALALLHRPPVVILDEPTEGLDPNQRGEIRTLIRELSQDRTFIISTHVMQEATAVCSRLLVLNHGELVADGTPEELTRRVQGVQVITAELEGGSIEEALRGMKTGKMVAADQLAGDRTRVVIEANGEGDLAGEVSRLIHEYRWLVRRLVEEEQTLEEVFQKLTNDDA